MARPRKPTNVLALKGAFKHDPDRGRARENEPAPVQAIGDPPGHLTAGQMACWREIVSLAHPGVLCQADRIIVEQLAALLNEARDQSWKVHPTVLGRIEMGLGKLGMTPADRSKVAAVIGKEKGVDPLDEFAA